MQIENIIFPNTLDADHQDDLVVKVKGLQNFFKAQLHVVWINTPLNFVSDKETLIRLEAFARKHKLRNYQLHIYNHQREEEGILQFAEQIKGNLIAIGTHGRKRVAHFLMGSLAEDVVNHAHGVVWTYSLQNELAEA